MSLRDATRLRLEETLGQVPYADLRAHLDRDAVFLVDTSVSLLDCAVSIAMDDVEIVRAWIDSRQIRKPSRQERKDWPVCAGRLWWAVVVEPYVLVQNP
jgi:hypothetical protein